MCSSTVSNRGKGAYNKKSVYTVAKMPERCYIFYLRDFSCAIRPKWARNLKKTSCVNGFARFSSILSVLKFIAAALYTFQGDQSYCLIYYKYCDLQVYSISNNGSWRNVSLRTKKNVSSLCYKRVIQFVVYVKMIIATTME